MMKKCTELEDIKDRLGWAKENLDSPLDNLEVYQVDWLIEQAEEAERLNKQLSKQVEMGYRFEGMVHDLTKENKIYKQTLRDLGDIVTGIPSKMAKDALKRFE